MVSGVLLFLLHLHMSKRINYSMLSFSSCYTHVLIMVQVTCETTESRQEDVVALMVDSSTLR